MSNDASLMSALKKALVVPLVQSNDPDEAVAICQALLDGGLTVLEVVLRTDDAFSCLEAICKAFPDVHVGAGTVLSGDQAQKAFDCGATFIVSPGLHASVVDVCRDHDRPVLPGIATATELQTAWNMGLRTVKFFPAALAGGPEMLGALSSVFRDVTFMPTGGVGPKNLTDYLSLPAVVACGGSWLTPKDAIAKKEFGAITKLAQEARDIASTV